MNASAELLSPVLAGPILRRVTTERVALWLAVTNPYMVQVTFSQDGHEPQTMKPDVGSDAFRCVKAGENLYYLMVDVRLSEPLETDKWVDYTVELKEKRKRKWLDVAADCPELCYEGQDSLRFQIPSRVSSVLHGSCRKPHHDSGDGLVEADNFIQRLLTSEDQAKPAWPSMLVMGGDQIYADDVAGPMLRAIHSVIEKLDMPPESFDHMGAEEITNSEKLYHHHDTYYRRAEILPKADGGRAVMDVLFEGVKKPIFTTDTANNHLISLGEHLCMYLMVWSPVLWDYAQMDQPGTISPEDEATFTEEKAVLERFVKGLGQVRRVMAHLPVAMIFDDHDVTDDWNLNRGWEEAVYNNPFSRRMISNGLSAYMINQGWGNKPEQFDDHFMDALEGLLVEMKYDDHQAFGEKVLSFQGWEYEWQTEPPLLVIDSRTRRWRSESSPVQPSGLLDWEAVCDLQQNLSGKDNVLLVSPAPIFGMKLIETIQKVFTWFGKPLVVDAENWMAHPGTANSILNVFFHSKTPQNFVILSGDVHYSFAYDVDLRRRSGGPDIWQITSSGMKNEFPKKLLDILDILNRWMYAPNSPLNWFTRRRAMRITPRKPEGHADGRRLLNTSGIGFVELNEQGQPWRIRQLVCGGKAIEFDRMENHSRWG